MPAMSPFEDPNTLERNAEDLVQLEQMLRIRIGHRIHDLQVSVEPHGVVISGYTDSYYDKQMAQHMAMESCRHPIAENRIQVRSKAAGRHRNPDDDAVTPQGPHSLDTARQRRPIHSRLS